MFDTFIIFFFHFFEYMSLLALPKAVSIIPITVKLGYNEVPGTNGITSLYP